MPTKWSDAVLILIFKKGYITVCTHYRRIAVLNTVYKILASLIKKRLDKYDKVIGNYQAVFRKGRSENEQIFMMKRIFTNIYKSNLIVHALFIDFKQGYERILKIEICKRKRKCGNTEQTDQEWFSQHKRQSKCDWSKILVIQGK